MRLFLLHFAAEIHLRARRIFIRAALTERVLTRRRILPPRVLEEITFFRNFRFLRADRVALPRYFSTAGRNIPAASFSPTYTSGICHAELKICRVRHRKPVGGERFLRSLPRPLQWHCRRERRGDARPCSKVAATYRPNHAWPAGKKVLTSPVRRRGQCVN